MPTTHEDDGRNAVLVHLNPSLRAEVEAYSAKAGVSLESFMSTASAELIRRRKEEEWHAKPRRSTAEGRAEAIAILRRPSDNPPIPGDELSEEYLAWEQEQERKSRRKAG